MTAIPAGRHSIGRDGLVPFVDRRRGVRSHRRPPVPIRARLGQLADAFRALVGLVLIDLVVLPRTEGQPETAGATVPEPRWVPGTMIPEYRPEDDQDDQDAPEDDYPYNVVHSITFTDTDYRAAGPNPVGPFPSYVRPYVLRNEP